MIRSQYMKSISKFKRSQKKTQSCSVKQKMILKLMSKSQNWWETDGDQAERQIWQA